MTYREVVRPPWWMYGVTIGLAALLCFTFAAAATVPVALVAFVLMAVAAVALVWRRRLQITVDDVRLQVGTQSLPRAAIGEVTALDATGVRDVAGPSADPRAHLILRNLATKQGVKIEVIDGAVPYWLVSSGRPERLAAALSSR